MADMARRRSSVGMPTEGGAKKRKYTEVEVKEEQELSNTSSSDFPCHHCSAVFVTQISLSRHMLTFHDAEINVKEEVTTQHEQYEDYKEENADATAQNNYDEDENGYFENDGDYYYDVDGNESVDMPEYMDPTGATSQQEGASDIDELIMGVGFQNQNFPPTKNGSNGKPKLSPEDLATVLAEVEQITSVTTSEFVTCPLCRKTFGRKELPIHISCEHGGTKFTCPYCSRAISRRDHLKRHIKNVHPEMCTETEIGPFPRNLNLSRATITSSQQKKACVMNNQQEIQQQETQVKVLPISIMTPRVQVTVEEDDEEDDFEGEDETRPNNNSAINSEDDGQNDSMQITVEPDLPFQDFNDYSEDDYPAPNFLLDCIDQFQSKMNSTDVMNGAVTLENMAFQCSLCNAVFTSKVLLDRHEATHSELRPHKCNVCGKGFLRKEHLSKHLSSVHSGMKFTCEFCGKDISRKDHLIRHIRNVHPNQFYALPQDGANELTAQHFQAVQLKTVQSLQPKPKKPFFNCDMCEATFINVDDLHAHQATVHSDVRKYKCNYCCKAFKRKEHLTKHEVLHTGERKFPCQICRSEFLRKDALHDHIRRTHGIDHRTTTAPKAVPTLPCNLCDQLFQDRGMLLSHMTTVHGLIVNSPPGLPKNIQQQRQTTLSHLENQSKHTSSQRNGGAKPNAGINGSNLGSLMDLINKGSITLSFHPVKSD